MVAVAGCAFWLRGWVLEGFIGAIVLGILYEWAGLVGRFAKSPLTRAIWMLAGLGYVGVAGWTAMVEMAPTPVDWPLPFVVGSVIAVDVGAYFAGRAIGGPKIAPRISPSKTWSGLGGAVIAASAYWLLPLWWQYRQDDVAMHLLAVQHGLPPESLRPQFDWPLAIVAGALIAVIAQSGDFFESWMKRRAGVKDSGSLIPGHGGLFDRADGLIAVLFLIGVLGLVADGVHGQSSQLSFRGVAPPHGSALGDGPRPNSSPEGEGLRTVSGVHLGLFVIRVAR